MIVYIDVLLVTNFLISYFLFVAASLLTGYTYNRIKLLIASCLGALCCLYILFPHKNILFDTFVKIISLVLCSMVAYGTKNKKQYLMQSICYVFFNMLVTGIAVATSIKSNIIYEKNMFFYFDISPIMLVTSSAFVYLLVLILEFVKNKVSPKECYEMSLFFNDFTVYNIPAFYDTGFKIKDIISNNNIVLVSFEKTKEHMPFRVAKALKEYFDGTYTDNSVMIIPVFFSSIQGGGMLPAIKTDYIILDGKKINNTAVAFTDNGLSENVSAIFGTDIKRQI